MILCKKYHIHIILPFILSAGANIKNSKGPAS